MAEFEPPTRFRVLIIGRANAGKTTILQAVCGTEEEPEIYDRKGHKVRFFRSAFQSVRDKITGRDSSVTLAPSAMRGHHDIEYSLVFPSNPGLVFHDSRGFESGATEELELVREFIQSRAAKGTLEEQLHAIWYCFPTDSNRIITAAEQGFFEKIDTGRVPVIAIFTKFDALDVAAFRILQDNGASFEKAKQDAPNYAEEQFNNTHLPLINKQAHPPKAVVCLRNMQNKELIHQIQKGTTELIEKTMASLDDDALKLLLVLVQYNNVELCIKAAVESGTITNAAQALAAQADTSTFKPERRFFMDLFKWFPYVWTEDTLENKGRKFTGSYSYTVSRRLHYGGGVYSAYKKVYTSKYYEDYNYKNDKKKKYNNDDSDSKSKSGYNLGKAGYVFKDVLTLQLPSIVGSLSPPLQVLAIGLAAIIVAANAFWLQPGDVHASNIQNAFQLYITSGASDQVRVALLDTFSGIVGPYNTPTYKAKIFQIVLNNHIGLVESKPSGSMPGPRSMAQHYIDT